METPPPDDLIQAVNKEWTARYGGTPVSEIRTLIMRVRKLAEDRDCMMANWRASEAELRKMHNKKKDDKPGASLILNGRCCLIIIAIIVTIIVWRNFWPAFTGRKPLSPCKRIIPI